MTDGASLVHLDWAEAAELIQRSQNIAVVTHVYPDGDAIGSMMGLVLALRQHGKQATPVVDGGLPRQFAFVPGGEEILKGADGLSPDLVISTDASDLERLGKAGAALRNLDCPFIQLDHHQTNLLFGDVDLVDARTVASAEVVFDWLEQLGWTPSRDVAQALLTGIVTDTMCFRTSNVTAETLAKSQRLMSYGADLAGIVQRTLARQPFGLIRLYGQVLPRIRLDNGIIWVKVLAEDYKAVDMEIGEYNGLSGYLIQADEAMISVVFKQMSDREIEVSMRAVPGFDVSQVALELGGGGHRLASGCTLRGVDMEGAVQKVMDRLQVEIARGKPLYT
ncbi:MAG: bifunctional oligoribonuclease/PAP phosphatase NrnA [Chloroflexi bacterium]|nr:bifunctional oligoribonuclease/PAP phosphatase NrnA [Chloroflexota bacterium]